MGREALQHKVKPSAVFPRDPAPSGINPVVQETCINGLIYLLIATYMEHYFQCYNYFPGESVAHFVYLRKLCHTFGLHHLNCRELLGKANPLGFMYEPPPGFAKGTLVHSTKRECSKSIGMGLSYDFGLLK